jgi:hypothetical protein
VRVIFSCENTWYMWWQAEFLHYTYSLAGMQPELTALVAYTEDSPKQFACSVFSVANYKDLVPGGPLLVLNKPGGIAEWAAQDGPVNETVFIVDPDSMFLRPVADPGPIPADQAYSEAHDYMSVDIPRNKTVLDRHCNLRYRSRVQPVGIYILINRAPLAELAKLWLAKSAEIMTDHVSREALDGTGWLSDMWGYCIAAAELGICHHIRNFSQVTGSDSLSNPITHYCYPVMEKKHGAWHPATQKPILWSKWSYVPWSDPPDSAGATAEGKVLLEHLRDFVYVSRVKPHLQTAAPSRSSMIPTLRSSMQQ